MCDDLLGQVLSTPAPALPIIVVTTAAPSAATAWAAERGLPPCVTVLCDERRALHAALGLPCSVKRTFTFRRGCANWLGLLSFPYQACCKRRLPGVNAGDPWQQAGVFVLRALGEPAFCHREESPGWPLLEAAQMRRCAGEVAAAAAAAAAPGEAKGGARQRR
jgi:hypothetical protein